MIVAGISAFYHTSACCLLVDGELVAAVAEERLSRVKHDPRLPARAFHWCLEAAGVDLVDLDVVAFYERPEAKLARLLWSGPPISTAGRRRWVAALDPPATERAIREGLGWDGPLDTYEHHRSHAASAYFLSGFPEAAVLTVDGVGEWATTTYGRGEGSRLESFEQVDFPHSLGLFYSTLTSYLGFAVNDGEYKVMGLAPYGRPRYREALRRLLLSGPGGGFQLDLDYFDFVSGDRMYSERLPELLEGPPRAPGEPLEARHRDVAASLQAVLEETLLDKAHHLHRETGSPRLAFAGGVALNCVANGRLRRESPFEEIFVPPAAGDDGGAVGAALLAHLERTADARPFDRIGRLRRAGWGPAPAPGEVAALVAAAGLPHRDFSSDEGGEPALVDAVAERLAEGAVVGWLHGRAELGPRALGARSILADPRDPSMRDRLNRMIKKREGFRPFAPSVLADAAGDWFELDHPSPFMLETCRVRRPEALPAVTHVDGSARPQTVDPAVLPRFAALLAAFGRRTGCPVLVNTSFNVAGEPIVTTPADALFTMAEAGLDLVVLEDVVVERRDLPAGWLELLAAWNPGGLGRRRGVGERLYTFV